MASRLTFESPGFFGLEFLRGQSLPFFYDSANTENYLRKVLTGSYVADKDIVPAISEGGRPKMGQDAPAYRCFGEGRKTRCGGSAGFSRFRLAWPC